MVTAPTTTRPVPLTGPTAAVAAALDHYLDTRLTLAGLVDRLWNHWPVAAGDPASARDRAAVTAALAPHLDALKAALEALHDDEDHCASCSPRELCPDHQRAVKGYWNVRDAAAAAVLHQVPRQAAAAIRGEGS